MFPQTLKDEAPISTAKTITRELKSYRRLWWTSVLLISLASLTPLLIMTIVHYYQYQKAVQAELMYPISRLLANTKRSLESVINERKSALQFLAREKTSRDLTQKDFLQGTFTNLKESFGGFVDLGLIDSDGNQISYVGPYDLEGKNYRDQAWFHEVYLRGVHVSDVFMGYRNFPHFVIAVKHEREDGKNYVLRATIDTEMLDQQMQELFLGPNSDVFIINKEGILQTSSRFHGKLLQPVQVKVPYYTSGVEVVQDFIEDKQPLIFGYAYIERSPFILMTIQNRHDLMKNWVALRNDPIWFLLISIGLILLVVLGGSTYMVNRVRQADIRRAKAFHNMEYTNKMASIGRLAASVAHEINNPLAIINEKAGLLKDIVSNTPDFTRREKFVGLLDSIANSVERCSIITHRLLGFAKRMDIRKELIDLGHIIKEVLGFLGKEVEHRNISIHVDIPDNFPHIDSDRGQLQQVFLNIINNAFAALQDGGWIKITLQEKISDEVAVSICDNGSGISAENLKHIFEPFFSTKGEFGTGLGLSITKEIVEKLGGAISVESTIGEGTCFTVTLPSKKD